MSNSLQDQLVKAGLATQAQAKSAQRQKRAEELAQRKTKNPKKGPGETPKRAPTKAEQAKKLAREKAQRDKALAKNRNDKYAQRALRAEIRQIIAANDKRTKVTDEDAVPYNFLHGKKVKRIYVTKVERDLLSSGKLIVINNDGVYHFVEPSIADKIAQRDPKRIIVAHNANENKTAEQTADDEYYAKYEVPDDLDW